MAYSELIKNFGSIRKYLRSFYVYGFQYRGEYGERSARSYDNERRRVESWLGDYMAFSQDAQGRRVFLSVDSRAIPENPLYRAFRAKSFTDRDMMLHFHLLDMLSGSDGLPISAVMEELTDRLMDFEKGDLPDESTVRKKLKEYADLGLIQKTKKGRETFYSLSPVQTDLQTWDAAAAFFSEAAPLGVIGAFLQDQMDGPFPYFRFKHHYILNALDSEILLALFDAMRENRLTTLLIRGQRVKAVPLKIYVGTQTGRQYVLVWSPGKRRFSFHRVDLIDAVKPGEAVSFPEDFPEKMRDFCGHAWGIASHNYGKTTHLEMTVQILPGEDHILRRLHREKRCGQVERVDETHWRFSLDAYDALEALPFLRTFMGRVTALECTDPQVTRRFWADVEAMGALYQGEKDAVS